MLVGLRILGTTIKYPLKYKDMLKESGFVNITERKFSLPLNAWPPSEKLQNLGAMMTDNMIAIIDALTFPVFMLAYGWSHAAIETLLAEVRKEWTDTRLHIFTTLYALHIPADA